MLLPTILAYVLAIIGKRAIWRAMLDFYHNPSIGRPSAQAVFIAASNAFRRRARSTARINAGNLASFGTVPDLSLVSASVSWHSIVPALFMLDPNPPD